VRNGTGRVARWRRQSYADVPERVRRYKPKLHGQGDEGVRQWKVEALAWLHQTPDRRLPCGDALGVLRTSVRLMGGWDGPWHD